MKKKLLSFVLASAMVLAMGASSVAAEEDGTQGVTDNEVKIANTAAVSGAYAPVGVPFIAGIQAYLDYINDAGGIDGRQITFIHKDDEFDPVKGKAYLQEMVEDEKVFAIVGVERKGMSLPMRIRTAQGFDLVVDGDWRRSKSTGFTLSGPVKKVFDGEIDLDSLDVSTEME